MLRKTVSGIMLTLLLVGMLALAFNIQPVRASGTIYIRADGSIDPDTAPISTVDNITYTFTDSINNEIIIERDNIVVDGAGYALQGTGSGKGIDLAGRSNVTIHNINIERFEYGIYLASSYFNTISINNITENWDGGIYLFWSSDNNIISGNNITNNWDGVSLSDSSNNNISKNNIANNNYGICLQESSNNSISGNNVTDNTNGIGLYYSSNNNIFSGNLFVNNGLSVWDSYGNVMNDNLVNGKPLVYLENISDRVVKDAGQVILVRCNRIRVENLSLSNATYSVQLCQTNNTEIAGNNITANDGFGIRLDGSSNNIICGNNIMNNEIGIGLYYSDNNSFSGDNIANNDYGIGLWSSSNNSIYGNVFIGDGLYLDNSYNNVVDDNLVNGKPLAYLDGASNLVVEDAGQVILENCNNVTVRNLNLSHTTVGVQLLQSNSSTIINNNITANKQYGVKLYCSNNNSFSGNNIENNEEGGIYLHYSSGNKFYHNNFYSYGSVYSYDSVNIWDDGYPSGGNYWSYYTGVDLKSGPDQDQPGSDGIGDRHYIIDDDNRDHYPLMNPWWPPPEDELVVSVTAPASIPLDSSALLHAIVTNQGLNDEVNVEFSLLVNGATVNSTTVPTLKAGDSHTLSHLWIPTVQGTYNVTAYTTPVPGETSVENNQETAFIRVVQVGVKAGDWIKYDYTITGWPAGTPYPEWLKVEFLSVEGTNATVRVTMHMSDGTEQNATVPMDVVAGGQVFGLSGFIIPASSKVGDSIYMSGYGNITIAGETKSTYAGASRTVVYASFSQYETQLTYYWDKQTGVMVEASTTSGTMTGTGKATETNMWQAAPSLPIDPIMLCVLIVIVMVIVIAFLLVRRKKKSKEVTTPEIDRHE